MEATRTHDAYCRLIGSDDPGDNIAIAAGHVGIWDDGVHLLYKVSRSGEDLWYVRSNCKQCGKEEDSTLCRTLGDVGKQLVEFTPEPFHYLFCYSRVRDESIPREEPFGKRSLNE